MPDRDVRVSSTVSAEPLALAVADTCAISSPLNHRNRSTSCDAVLRMSFSASKSLTTNGLRWRWVISTGSPTRPDRSTSCIRR
ncbi:hypothetical protein C1Y40_05534 [Mycobacterium talmoniae]|uniref:Uncharacterized protein n=1 Tax=Mycobacterium talmoniae TaxID=1858794 RepID=A0A2S8BCC4_9MYCO|nr:hypothetical protein C1Y40_05534 [Mycobacterium talmoniae]